jgi:hypothetical protein
MKKLWNFCLNTKLGHFLSLFIVSSIVILMIILFADAQSGFKTHGYITPFVMIFALALGFALTDKNENWY